MPTERETDGHFSDALARFERMASREGAHISVEGRSRLLHHGRVTPRVHVLLHGLTTTPAQFSDFAAALHDAGANVVVPRLPRHGHADRMTHELADLTAREMVEAAIEVVSVASGLGERVTVTGFSAGGMLAAWIAQHLAVDRVVTIAPFLGLGWIPTRVGRTFSGAMLRAPNLFLWWHPLERERHAPVHGYPQYSTHAVARVWRLGLDVLEQARVKAPATRDIVVVRNASETAVNNRAVVRLAQAWRAHAGDTVRTRVLTGLPRSHDIVEPHRRRALAQRVFPELLAIVTGTG